MCTKIVITSCPYAYRYATQQKLIGMKPIILNIMHTSNEKTYYNFNQIISAVDIHRSHTNAKTYTHPIARTNHKRNIISQSTARMLINEDSEFSKLKSRLCRRLDVSQNQYRAAIQKSLPLRHVIPKRYD